MLKMITEHGLSGFHLTLDNGCTVSVQQGKTNYCDSEKGTVEVAAWDKQGNWIRLGDNDDVIGWQSWEQVEKIIRRIKRRK